MIIKYHLEYVPGAKARLPPQAWPDQLSHQFAPQPLTCAPVNPANEKNSSSHILALLSFLVLAHLLHQEVRIQSQLRLSCFQRCTFILNRSIIRVTWSRRTWGDSRPAGTVTETCLSRSQDNKPLLSLRLRVGPQVHVLQSTRFLLSQFCHDLSRSPVLHRRWPSQGACYPYDWQQFHKQKRSWILCNLGSPRHRICNKTRSHLRGWTIATASLIRVTENKLRSSLQRARSSYRSNNSSISKVPPPWDEWSLTRQSARKFLLTSS